MTRTYVRNRWTTSLGASPAPQDFLPTVYFQISVSPEVKWNLIKHSRIETHGRWRLLISYSAKYWYGRWMILCPQEVIITTSCFLSVRTVPGRYEKTLKFHVCCLCGTEKQRGRHHITHTQSSAQWSYAGRALLIHETSIQIIGTATRRMESY